MTSRTYRKLCISLLAFFALAIACMACISIWIDYFLWDLFQGGSLLSFRPSWDSLLFATIFLVTAAATVGIRMRRGWARTAPMFAAGGTSIWALAMALLPERLHSGLSLTVDPWVAWITVASTIGTFVWLCSARARAEFQGSEI